jgi:parvulin-like peptidyl-prolyl isomerase
VSPVFWTTTGLLVGLMLGTLINSALSYRPQYNYDQVVATAGETTVTRGVLAETALFRYGTRVLEDELKRSAMVKEAARRAGITVADAEVEKRIADYKSLLQQYADLPELMGSKLQLAALPDWLLRDQFLVQLYAEKLLRVEFTEKEMEKKTSEMYTGKMEQFIKPPLANLTLIVVKDENEAWKLHRRLRDGEDARVLSAKYSAYDAIKKISGEIGWVPRSQMSPELARAIFDVRNGAGLRAKEFTDVIPYKWPIDFKIVEGKPVPNRTETNYVILYVHGTEPGKKTPKSEVQPVLEFLVRTTETANRLSEKDKVTGKDWFENAKETITWKRVPLLADPLGRPEVIPEPGQQPIGPGNVLNPGG